MERSLKGSLKGCKWKVVGTNAGQISNGGSLKHGRGRLGHLRPTFQVEHVEIHSVTRGDVQDWT